MVEVGREGEGDGEGDGDAVGEWIAKGKAQVSYFAFVRTEMN